MSNALTALSPLDGRYQNKTSQVAKYFSEEALIKNRIKIETEFLTALQGNIIRKFTDKEKELLKSLSKVEVEEVKEIEKETNHDVKAVEYFIKRKIETTSLKDVVNFIHFGLTSEDVNNLAYGLLISDFIKDVYLPQINNIIDILAKKSDEFKDLAMLSRTHGQPATPTTLGKEFNVFIYRLKNQLKSFSWKMSGKLAGASGNFNSFVAAYPQVDWLEFSQNFVKSLGLEPWVVVTQIEPHDRFCELFGVCQRINNILLDFCRDIWLYITFDYFSLKVLNNEVGSSTMPHKINPIDFENAEGNLGVSNALFAHFIEKLPISRLQRDLSDSTVQRSIGSGFGYTIIAFESLLKGLGKIQANVSKIKEDLNNHPEILAEAYQTILRRENVEFPYEKLKQLTRGKKIILKDLQDFIDNINVSDKVKQELKALSPKNYLGIAVKLAQHGSKNS